MPIQPLLDAEGAVFGPEDIRAIAAAFEIALERQYVTDRKAAMALLVARTTDCKGGGTPSGAPGRKSYPASRVNPETRG
jgi:hypothetical protein